MSAARASSATCRWSSRSAVDRPIALAVTIASFSESMVSSWLLTSSTVAAICWSAFRRSACTASLSSFRRMATLSTALATSAFRLALSGLVSRLDRAVARLARALARSPPLSSLLTLPRASVRAWA